MSHAFWAMGGYAAYVWPCIGLAIAGLLWNLWAASRYYEHALQRARRAIAMAASEQS